MASGLFFFLLQHGIELRVINLCNLFCFYCCLPPSVAPLLEVLAEAKVRKEMTEPLTVFVFILFPVFLSFVRSSSVWK